MYASVVYAPAISGKVYECSTLDWDGSSQAAPGAIAGPLTPGVV